MSSAPNTDQASWSKAKLVAFRFLFCYLILFFLAPFGLIGQATGLSRLGSLWAHTVKWVGLNLFDRKITTLPNGSGDTLFNYVEIACWLILAAFATIIWTHLDKKSRDHEKLSSHLRQGVRGYLAAIMLAYGMNKLIPLQFGSPRLIDMLQPTGEQSPMGMLWRFMGISPGYTMFTGFAEVLAAYLIAFRRTTLLGSVLCFVVMSHVVALNFFYDVPVKLLSTQLLLLSLLLIAPDFKRLWSFLILQESEQSAPQPSVLSSKISKHLGSALKLTVLGLYPLMVLLNTAQIWMPKFRDNSRPPLYGIWQVQQFKLNNQPLKIEDPDRMGWHKLVIESVQTGSRESKNVGIIVPVGGPSTASWNLCQFDEAKHTITFTPFDRRSKSQGLGEFTVHQSKQNQVTLTGTLQGKNVEIDLERLADEKIPLLHRGFHWINEYPYSR